MTNQIRFRKLNEPYGSFSNFSADTVMLDGTLWPTVEHYYQAMKHPDPDFQKEIRQAPTPKAAKQLAYTRPARADWDQDKQAVMLKALRAKFDQHEDLQDLLIYSGDAEIIEDSPWDGYWGCGSDGKGKNVLGRMLMHLRSEIKMNRGHAPIIADLVAGRTTPENALARSLEVLQLCDRAIPKHIKKLYADAETKLDSVHKQAEALLSIQENGEYDLCHRGVFVATIFAVHPESMYEITEPAFTAPPEDLVKVCKWSGGCVRDHIHGRSTIGVGYNNCPSVHALERCLYRVDTSDLWGEERLWIELGLVRGESGDWEEFVLKDCYPCLQCLRGALNAGVRYLAIPQIHNVREAVFCDVAAHASHLIVRETVKALGQNV